MWRRISGLNPNDAAWKFDLESDCMAKSSASEKRKRIMLAALGGLLVIIVGYQFMTGVDKPSSSKKSQDSNSAAPTASTPTTTAPPAGQLKPTAGPAPSPKSSDEQEQLIALLIQDMTPLDLNAVLKGPRTGTKPDASAANETRESPFTEPGKRGSIFAEWQAPPPPQNPPDPPPPITIGGTQPSSVVAGTPRTFTLTIRGSKIPADAQILFDGRPKPTTRVNESELTTKIEPGEYAFPRTINIDVKSQSDPVKNYSNPVQFVVQAAPVPQFRYLGYVGGQASLESFADKKIRLYSRGSEIEGWRIDAISDKVVEVTHKTYEIKQQITLQPKPMQ